MSAYIVKSTGEYPMHFGDIIIRYPDATEDNIPDELALVIETPKPNKNEDQGIYESAPLQINGVWTQQWLVRDLTNEEVSFLQDLQQKRIDRINEESNG